MLTFNKIKATSQDLKDSLGLKVDYYDDLELLLNKSKPNAVAICTPNELHYEQILKGKVVYSLPHICFYFLSSITFFKSRARTKKK